jgi:hypothetical protein
VERGRSVDLPFVLQPCADLVDRLVREHGLFIRECVYTPLVTLLTFLSQVLSDDHSCRKAVARLLAFLVARGEKPCSAATGPYCKARQRLPEPLLRDAAHQVGRDLDVRVRQEQFLGGRPIKFADGTTVSMPDSKPNQRAYPQHRSQKPGLGFPIARLVALVSFASGALLDVAIGPWTGKGTGEASLFRTLWNRLCPGDVLVADRYYASFWNLALLSAMGVDSVFRQHHLRRTDFRQGRRLGPDDHVVTLVKPKERPDWMDQETYDRLPDAIEVRELRVRIQQRGFRAYDLTLVTTLLDPAEAPNDELAAVYHTRWHCELDLRSIKSAMHMDVLRCKHPTMVRKEIWVHLLAYNLIRTVMADAAERHGIAPRTLSFRGAQQTFEEFLLLLADPSNRLAFYDALLDAIAYHRVGNRPGRREPRAVKRRPATHPLLTEPRHLARRRVA